MKRVIAVITLCLIATSVYAEPRNALLIANGQYKKFSKLANPVPEAEGLKKSLIELGFDVTIVTNASKEEMETAMLEFQKKLTAEKGIAIFHYGGHAVQVNGENYLIPADADIPDEPRVSSRAVNVSEVIASMQADTNIVILDSCRDNPLPSGSGRSATRGLQMVKVRPKNSIIVYSAEAGKTARDGVFTPILTQKILENKELISVLRDVRNEVAKATNDEQTPGQYDQLRDEIYLAKNIPSRLAKVEEDAAKLDKELERLRAKQNSSNSKEKQEAEIELRRVEAEAKRKQLELQQVREAEARRAAEEKRLAEEQAKRNENQKKQDEQFAKMQAENAAKLREIEKLKSDTSDLDSLVASANEIIKTINEIEGTFNTVMDKAIEETKKFYQGKRNEIKIGKWESDDEFAERKKSEEAEINRLEKNDVDKIKSDYENEANSNTASLRRQLDNLIKTPIVITGIGLSVTFDEYDRNGQRFPLTIADIKNPNVKYPLAIDVRSYDSSERNRKCQEVDNNIQTGGYVGYIEYGLVYNESEEKYIGDIRSVELKKLSDNETVASIDMDDLREIAENARAEQEAKEFAQKAKQYADKTKNMFVFVEGNEKVSSFYICDHEVTQAEYVAVIGSNPSSFKGYNKPVECVSWYDAIEYCNARSKSEGLTPYYTIDKTNKDPNNTNKEDGIKWTVTLNKSAKGYRLPTEAEWEYAARGGKNATGYTYSGSDNIDGVAWYDKNAYYVDKGSSDYGTHNVKTKQPNELGIYDMSGNVWEWCWDWWDWYDSNRSNNKDYAGPVSGRSRVVRGGSWSLNAVHCSVSYRGRGDGAPNDRGNVAGFRVVRSQ